MPWQTPAVRTAEEYIKDQTSQHTIRSTYETESQLRKQVPITNSKVINNVLEDQSYSSGTSHTIHSIQDSGVVKNFWFALNPISFPSVWWEFIVDGKSMVAADVDSTLLNGGVNKKSPIRWTWSNDLIHVQTVYDASKKTGVSFRYPVPFESSFEVVLHAPYNISQWFSNVTWESMPQERVPTYRLKTKSVIDDRDGFFTIPSGTSANLLDLPSGTRGYLAGLYWNLFNLNSSRVPIEADIDIYYNGEGQPSYSTTGTEDFFLGSWGMMQSKEFVSEGPTSVGINTFSSSPYKTAWGVNLLEAYGGNRFNDGIKMTLHNKENANEASLLYNLYYYEKF